MSAVKTIVHALVLPERDFYGWLEAARPYMEYFDDVAVLSSAAREDLCLYRDVSAIEAPGIWLDDSALKHVRRIHPQVVMVDVIAAGSPEELRVVMHGRVQRRDRYGRLELNRRHIFTRFVLEWPTRARPMVISGAFNSRPSQGPLREGIDIKSAEEADVLCGADGEATAIERESNAYGYRGYLQVESTLDGQRYVTIYEGIKGPRVRLGDSVTVGQVLGKSQDDRLRIILRKPPKTGYRFPHMDSVVNPRDYIYIPGFKVRPVVDGLRLRNVPSARGKIMGSAYSWDLLEVLERHGRACEKIGRRGQWIKARSIRGTEGYAAAWLLRATTASEGSEAIPGLNPVGVNLDVYHDTGRPAASRLGRLGWVRFGYNVSNFRGSEDIGAALERYLPLVESYREAGYRVIFTTSHQTYGEGKSHFWPWPRMTDAKWARLRARFAEMMGAIAGQWAGRDLVSAWQIWNEQDAPTGAIASVPMSAGNYTAMFAQAYRAIRSADSDVHIITGGFTGGPGRGASYARALLSNLPRGLEPDGIAFHPYGRGLNDQPKYAIWGHIDESVWAYSSVMPQKALWMTEWGVLDRPGDDIRHVTKYATDMVRHLKVNYPGKFAAIIWYAWAEGMHNGYGIVDRLGNPRPPLTERFLSL